MRAVEEVVTRLRGVGHDPVSTLDVPALGDPTARGGRTRVEVLAPEGRVVASVHTPPEERPPRPEGSLGHVVREVLERLAARPEETDDASNESFSALVGARLALPAEVSHAAVDAARTLRDLDVLNVAWSAIHLDELPERDVPAALTLLRDLAAGTPAEWALRRLVAPADGARS